MDVLTHDLKRNQFLQFFLMANTQFMKQFTFAFSFLIHFSQKHAQNQFSFVKIKLYSLRHTKLTNTQTAPLPGEQPQWDQFKTLSKTSNWESGIVQVNDYYSIQYKRKGADTVKYNSKL